MRRKHQRIVGQVKFVHQHLNYVRNYQTSHWQMLDGNNRVGSALFAERRGKHCDRNVPTLVSSPKHKLDNSVRSRSHAEQSVYESCSSYWLSIVLERTSLQVLVWAARSPPTFASRTDPSNDDERCAQWTTFTLR